MTNARLDHYVYTLEGIAEAKGLLKPGGVMTLTFEANKLYIADRIHGTLESLFGQAPLAFRIPGSSYGWGGLMFVTGEDPSVVQQALTQDPELMAHVQMLQDAYQTTFKGSTKPTTDDWPYLYLESRQIPPLFIYLAIVMSLIFIVVGRWVGLNKSLRNWRRPEWHFFFMGAAFMLLEILMINKSAVLLGNVWTVNAVIIFGILFMILLANLIKAKWKRVPITTIHVLLMVACAVVYLVDLAWLNDLEFAQKIVVLGLIATFPMLFSGIIFIDSFDRTDDKARALGANLFGALVGGLLQAATFLTGFQVLILMVGMFYLTAGAMVRWRPLN